MARALGAPCCPQRQHLLAAAHACKHDQVRAALQRGAPRCGSRPALPLPVAAAGSSGGRLYPGLLPHALHAPTHAASPHLDSMLAASGRVDALEALERGGKGPWGRGRERVGWWGGGRRGRGEGVRWVDCGACPWAAGEWGKRGRVGANTATAHKRKPAQGFGKLGAGVGWLPQPSSARYSSLLLAAACWRACRQRRRQDCPSNKWTGTPTRRAWACAQPGGPSSGQGDEVWLQVWLQP